MPRRCDLNSIAILGAGPITIGQACEFDYSGVQAVKALRADGFRVILINSNPATLMTDPELADATYIEPICPEFVEKILIREKPDALLATMGGQTALNCALALEDSGALERHNVELIGAKAHSIEKAEDRDLFRKAMTTIGLETPVSEVVTAPASASGYDLIEGVRQTLAAVNRIGLPVIIRPAFTLGGEGGGVAYNLTEVETIAKAGLTASPRAQILIDECLIGWKEYEMEVVRDNADNAIIVCSIENVDPMGVHTGDSITVAPALTLTDREMQAMRDAAIAVIREIGVDTGGSNVQFAVDPQTGRMVVIEMNPRVSRSSALASKATGFPIAKVAARLAVGYRLDELANDATGVTPASFEPSIDYVVTKIPRFAFEKYKGAPDMLTTSMMSVGEAMAIGSSFKESIHKAICSLETGMSGFDPVLDPHADRDDILGAVSRPSQQRLFAIADALRAGISIADIHTASRVDPWFLHQISQIVTSEADINPEILTSAEGLLALKMDGFSDTRIAKLAGCDENTVRLARHELNVLPVFRRVDTCAAEFAALTPYMYSTYARPCLNGEGQRVRPMCEARPEDTSKVVIIGGGPNRIGQGLEFDYCCCHAAFAMTDMGISSIMINCNPETVSTDYDTSDRLYFEPLTAEHVGEILHREGRIGRLQGVIVQFGGQTPLKLAPSISAMGIALLGTSLESIEIAENRENFSRKIADLGLRQPPSTTVGGVEEAILAADALGYPVLLRPSNVLGGRAMEIARNSEEIKHFASEAIRVSEGAPLLIDSFLNHAVEVDIDAIADDTDTHIVGVMQHIEEAGIHSGDSACAACAFSLPDRIVEELCEQTRALAKALSVRGLMNVQFAVKENDIFVLEANPRASRTVPFMAKATGLPFARIAAAIMAGRSLKSFDLGPGPIPPRRAAIKEAVFPFARFAGVDPVLGPEMRSTGEVMGIDDNFGAAFLKSQLAAGVILPQCGTCFISVKDSDKPAAARLARDLAALGLSIVATDGTADYLNAHQVETQRVNKVRQGRPHIVDAIVNGRIQMIVNTTLGQASLDDSASIRRTALMRGIACYTTLAGGQAALAALKVLPSQSWLEALPLQDYTLSETDNSI